MLTDRWRALEVAVDSGFLLEVLALEMDRPASCLSRLQA